MKHLWYMTLIVTLLGCASDDPNKRAIGKRLDKQAEELNEIAETTRTEKGLITKLKGDITFDTGEATLGPDALERIRKIGLILKNYPEDQITVEGHTDSTGPRQFNEQLSKERALAIKDVLTNAGVPAKNITTVGLGPSAPIASNATSEGRAANRRVELNVQVDESQLRAE